MDPIVKCAVDDLNECPNNLEELDSNYGIRLFCFKTNRFEGTDQRLTEANKAQKFNKSRPTASKR